MLNRPIILASGSPRRHQLLKDAGFEFTIKTRSIDEIFPDDMPKAEVAEYLAVEKAKAVEDWVMDDQIVITADSVVVLGDKIYNKPEGREGAFEMIKELSGNTHLVITGVCIASKEGIQRFSDVTKVFFDDVSDEEIWYYVDNYKPFDKAGAYGIQEWIGYTKVKKIEGSYYNVMGLPIHRVYKALMKLAKN